MHSLVLCALACAPLAARSQSVTGRVVDSATGRGIASAEVTASVSGGYARTDSTGAFTIGAIASGSADIEASRNDYAAVQRTVELKEGRTDTVNFVLRRSPPPCCKLAGQWDVRLMLDSAGGLAKRRPTAREVTGRMIFGPKIPEPISLGHPPDDAVIDESGRNYVDVSPFFGAPIGPQVSASVQSGDGPLLQEVVGTVITADQVSISTIPRVSHGGLDLSGRIRGDSIAGTWVERAYCCGARGHFTMHRVSTETPEVHDPPPPPPPPPEDRSTWGRARIRIWEESAGRYVAIDHDLELPDGGVKGAYSVGTEPDGWGKTIELPPGRYGVDLTELPCGGKVWFLLNPMIKRFTVVTGQLTDVTVRFNIHTARAAKSFDNPTGARCHS